MTTNPANIQDLRDRSLGTLDAASEPAANAWLGDAWAIVETRLPGLAARLDEAGADSSLHRVSVQVVCAIVLRVLKNPDGKFKENIEDYGYQLDASVATGELYVSDAELDLLAPDAGGGGAFSITPRATPDPQPDTWARFGAAKI